MENGVLSTGFDVARGEGFLVEREGEEIPAPGAFPGGGVPEDHPRRRPIPRKEGEVDAGPRFRGCPVDEQGKNILVRTDDDGPRDILSQDVHSGFVIVEMEETFLLEDPEDQFGSPLAKEKKFAPFGVVCGYDPREGAGRLLAGTHFHPEGEGERKIDGASGPEKRFRSRHDPEAFKPKAG
jgi:hypothetical protein